MGMNRLAVRTFTVCVLVLICSATKGQTSQCDDRWFGDKCQYQCHCLNGAVCDKTTGECLDGCDEKWFGPQCQYWDAAYNTISYLTDGNESTHPVNNALGQDFPMLNDVMFTWMRIVTNRPGLLDRVHVNVTFLSRSGANVVPKSQLTRINLTDTILDIYGELQDRFKTIRLNFDTAETRRSFCSMHVSSGRNVAIKQNVSQSSTARDYVAEKAVDGKSNQILKEGSCSATDIKEDIAYWTLNLSLPVTVNMYTILGRNDWWALCRLRYFRLESYFESTKVLQYVKTDTAEQSSYNVYPMDTSTITSVTLIVSKDLWPSNKFDCNDGYLGLSFCEMQIYGDVVCPQGKWGRDCENNCNCQDPTDSCFVSTGMCPSGCKAGFQGPGCQQCEDGWFGDKCQYQCHCLNNAVCDKTTGECPDGCDVRWFGPQCQYWDAAYNRDSYLTDGNESTCLDNNFKTQMFKMSYDVMFTWMRIVTKEKGQFDRVNITFLSHSGAEVVPSSPLRRLFLSDTILDLHGELQVRFKSIRLDFATSDTSRLFCSMQVSLGRNVAIKQKASQSSTINSYVAENAVDGKPNQRLSEGSCTATGIEDSPYWTLNLSLPVTVNMYTILGRIDPWALCRLHYFRLESYLESTEVLQYDKKDPVNQTRYDVYPVGTSLINSVTLTVYKSSWPSGCNSGKTGLSFCEMQIYGDVVCQPGKWGRECEKDCNCQEPCYVSTGMCPCKAGFSGPGCKEECEEGQWGLDCLNSCDNCIDRKCNKSSGECLSGCVRGYKMPFCVEECDAGFHGYNCNQNCSENCLNSTCDNVNGRCIQCKAGYQGPLCDQECNAGFHGYNCNQTCSENCLNSTCNNVDGRCIPCVAGYQGPLCDQECNAGFHGYNCNQTCSENCLNSTCNNVDGRCIPCVAGYQGPLCDQDGFSNTINGSCLSGCKPGYSSDNCEQTCANNTYGEGCNKTCSVNCMVNATEELDICDHVTGQCLLGCQSSYSGITCEKIPSDPDETNPAIVVVPIILVIIVIAALFFGIWFWRRRKAQMDENGETVQSSVENSNGELENVGIHVESSDHSSPNTNLYEMAKEIREDEVNVYINIPTTQAKFSETAIPVESLGEFLASHNMDFFTEQFQRVPKCRATTKAAESSENKHKNRYKNIPAYDHSRVQLEKDTEKKQGDYYNASFIQGFDGAKYIAAQAPNTGVLADFIRMIWEQDVELVVMLTKVVEDGKAKCECYWPINDSTEVTYGEITVKLAVTQVLADYTKRTLQLIKNDGQSHYVTQFHFTSWPDKGVPQTPWALVDFEQVVDYHYDTEKPLLVHCSAGVGRTGTFIGLRNVLKEAKVTGYIDFYQTLAKMRQDRIFMIQTVEQYRFLHDAAQVALLCQDALMTSDGLDARMMVLMEVTETGETNMEKEFKMVCDLVKKENSNDSASEKEAAEYVNSDEIDQNLMTNVKNRFSDILAKMEHRPKLSFDPQNDYINAVLVPSMTKQDQQVLTQLPLHNTVDDFWSLVTQYNVSLILAFDSDKQNKDKPVGDYLPEHNNPLKCGHYEISEDKLTLGAFWEKKKIHVQAKSLDKDSFYVHHIKCTKSKLDTEDWLLLINELHSMDPLRGTRTVYMCMNGADQSGFACVVSLLISRVEHDHFLTVPLVVGEIKSIRPEVIPNKDQYCSLYRILQLHCEKAHIYTNHTPHAMRKVQNSLKLHPKPEHVYSNTTGETKEVSPHQEMPAGSKAQVKKTVSNDKPESKEKIKYSKSQPVSSPEQALSKQSLEPQNGPENSEFNVYCNEF